MGCLCSTGAAPGAQDMDSNGEQKYKHERLTECYELGDVLGSGGSCQVYRADGKGKVAGEQFAVKVMERAGNRKINERLFEKEVQILKDVEHTNIIKLRDSFEDKEYLFVVTELCLGGELFDRIAETNKYGPFTEKRAAQLVYTMLDALHYLHETLNIVHRDLKPENFVFESHSPDAKMILIDFGCAKNVEDHVNYKDIVGTPYYLAPESAAKKAERTGAILKKSDVWAVGVIAYIMLTGTPPFRGREHKDILAQILRSDVSFPSKIPLSKGFKNFIKQTLVKRPRRRLNAEEAMTHDWVVANDSSENAPSDRSVDKDILKCLKQFAQQTKLKKRVSRLLAANMGEDSQQKIKKHFQSIDEDGDETLDRKELAELLIKLGTPEDEAMDEALQMLKNADESADERIDFFEFSTIWQRKLLTVNDKYIRAVFNVIDNDKDRYITVDELRGMFQGMDLKEAQDMIDEVDADNDKKISFEEFKKAMKEEPAKNLGHNALLHGKVEDGLNEDLPPEDDEFAEPAEVDEFAEPAEN